MNTLFYPRSIALYGLSDKKGNTVRNILENCIRWGYQGSIFGVNPAGAGANVGGITVYRHCTELPVIPDLAVLLIPARHVLAAVEDCGKAGIRRLAIQSGGFNEANESGKILAGQLLAAARKYDIRFVGPNGLAVANTANGLCLPFVPSNPQRKGSLSMITQSGGLGLFLWNLLESEHLGLAKFASIGNKLDFDENDFLEYLGDDPETQVICLHLESIVDGSRLIRLAQRIGKPIIVYKASTTPAGRRTAMSHTAALGNNEDIVDTAFERAGIIRIACFRDFVTTAKAFTLPPMRGRRIMVMSPAGGMAVAMADECERHGFAFAEPGKEFYTEMAAIANAGIINFSNPLDMGDFYRIDQYPHIVSRVLSSEEVDGAIFTSQWPKMPADGNDVFTAMFNTDIYPAIATEVHSSKKPLALALYGHGPAIAAMKGRLTIPVFDGPEEAISGLKRQMAFHAHKARDPFTAVPANGIDLKNAGAWIHARSGIIGEETLDLLDIYGIRSPQSGLALNGREAGELADTLGYPVVMKVVSPDAIHKTEAGGVRVGIRTGEEAVRSFAEIAANLRAYRPDAVFSGVRVSAMAADGHDMFIGGLQDPAFGPVVFFGYGGIHVEVFHDIERALCPASFEEIRAKLGRLRSFALLSGIRGKRPVALEPFLHSVVTVSHLLVDFPVITELDLNPIRIVDEGTVLALDARMTLAAASGTP